MRRVLFLNPVGELGGGERSLLDLIASLREADPCLGLHVVAGTPGPLVERARALGAGVTVLALPDRLTSLGDAFAGDQGHRGAAYRVLEAARAGGDAATYALRLRRHITRLAPDVVHSNGMKMHLLGAMARGRTPLVWHIRDFVGARPLMSRALRSVGGRASLALANSRAVAEDFATVTGRPEVRVLYNAVDLSQFAPGSAAPETLDARAGMVEAPPGTLRVGLVATYARWKGQDLFLRAIAKLRAQRRDLSFRAYVVGGPIYRTKDSQFDEAELRALASSLGVTDVVGFVPFQDDPADVYRALDVVVHASTRPEPFGRTIAEAMACGRPVLAARAGGAAELLTHGEEGWLVPPNDVDALADALARLLSDDALRVRLSAAARRAALARFDRRRIGRELLSIYGGLIG